jgi:hypothetical protein
MAPTQEATRQPSMISDRAEIQISFREEVGGRVTACPFDDLSAAIRRLRVRCIKLINQIERNRTGGLHPFNGGKKIDQSQ